MPYVQLDSNGYILSLRQTIDDDHQEYKRPTDPDVINFLTRNEEKSQSKNVLAESDKDIARASEDLIYLLISKNIILFTELPDALQNKLLGREKLRSSLHGVMDNFLDDGEVL